MRLVASGLSHRFAGQDAALFESLSFTLDTGRLVGLTGPSGSGKSTLMSILAGWADPTGGAVTHEGVERVMWVFQSPSGTARRSALDHVVLPLIARGWARAAAEVRALSILASFGLERHAGVQFRRLSGGEAQRLMFARAVSADPDLLLLDEPTSQLDARTAAGVVSYLRSLASADRLVVIATHDARAREACDDVIDLGQPR